MKKNYSFILFLALFLIALFPVIDVQAAMDSNSITVVKLKLPDNSLEHTSLPVDGSKANELVDEQGNILEPVEGISYLIQRVTPDQDKGGFKPITGKDELKVQIVTNKSGMAQMLNLAQGMYQITEEAQSKIKEPMKPVILELPLPRAQGDALQHVYLYPKSSVIDSSLITKPSEEKEGATHLPKTSGNIGRYDSIVWSFLLVILLGTLGFYSLYRKNEML